MDIFDWNLESRLRVRNSAQDRHTAKYRRRRIKNAIAFADKYSLRNAGCNVEKVEQKILNLFEIDKDE
jgi:hypothetical protein